MTDEGMSLESEIVVEGSVIEAGLTDKGMSLESEMIYEGIMWRQG